MTIRIRCACGKSLQAKEELAGKRVKCPGCGQVLAIPSGAGATGAPTQRPAALAEADSPFRDLEAEPPSAPQDEDVPAPRQTRKKKRRPPAPSFLSRNKWLFAGGGVGGAACVIALVVGLVVFGRPRPPQARGSQVALAGAEHQAGPAQPAPTARAPDPNMPNPPPAQPKPPDGPPPPARMPDSPPPEGPEKKPAEAGPPGPQERAPDVLAARDPPNPPPNPFGAIVHDLKGHTKPVTALAFLPGGKRALTGSDDRTLRLWDLETGQPIRVFEGVQSNFVSLVVTADGRRAFSGANTLGGGLILWDLETGKEVRRLEPREKNHFGALALSADGKRLLAAGLSTTLLFDVPGGKELRAFKPATGFAPLLGGGLLELGVALSPDDRHAFITDSLAIVRVYDTGSGKQVRQLGSQESSDMWSSAVFSGDARFLLTGSGGKLTINNRPVPIDFGVRLWDVRTGKMLRHCQGHTGDVRSLALSADGKRGLSAGTDKLVILWNTETGQELGRLGGDEADISRLALSADGSRALIGGKDGTVRLWQLGGPAAGDRREGKGRPAEPPPEPGKPVAGAREKAAAGAAARDDKELPKDGRGDPELTYDKVSKDPTAYRGKRVTWPGEGWAGSSPGPGGKDRESEVLMAANPEVGDPRLFKVYVVRLPRGGSVVDVITKGKCRVTATVVGSTSVSYDVTGPGGVDKQHKTATVPLLRYATFE
jgi:WD40 repeat protein